MSNGGRVDRGRPDAMVEAGYIFLRYCGGSGGGGCLVPLGTTKTAFLIRMPKFIVHHRRIIFENKEFEGIRIYTDAGADGFGCLHSLGVEQSWYMALSNSGVMADADIISRGIQLSGTLPYQIEFKEDKIPQPVEGGYSGVIYVHVYWGNAGYINENGAIDANSIKIVKHDYDITL
jgi:hypothetical protein